MNARMVAELSMLFAWMALVVAVVAMSERCEAAEAEDWFGDDRPLDERAAAAIEEAKAWLDAEQYPLRDGAAVTYLYGAGQPDLVCAPLNVCVVELQAGERVVPAGVHLGDSVRWQVAPAVGAADKTHLVIKPVDVGLETTMAVVTDRRTYLVRLLSRAEDYMPLVRWAYPEAAEAAWAAYHAKKEEVEEVETLPTGERLPDLNFGYEVSGCQRCAWRPVRVYDDGARTVIQMPWEVRQTEAPVLMIETGGERELVNYRVRGDRYVVDQVVDRAVLLSGTGRKQQKVEIERL